MSRVKTIIAVIFAVCVALFAVQNYEEVVIKFLFYNFKISQALIIVLTTAVGVAIGLIAGLNSSLRASKTTKQLNKSNTQTQQQVLALEEENKKLKDEIASLNEQINNLVTPIDSDDVINTTSTDI